MTMKRNEGMPIPDAGVELVVTDAPLPEFFPDRL
jgi:hypothetical protein